MTRVVFVLLLSIVAPLARAKTLFVATNGRDSNRGSEAEPFATITKAADMAKPGDLVNVRGGVYKGTVHIESRGRSESQQIIIRALPGETAILDGSSTKPGTDLVRLVGAEWVQFTGFEVRGATGIGISAWGVRHVTIADNRVHDCAGAGIWTGSDKQSETQNVTITGNTVTGNVLRNAAHETRRGWPQAIGVYKSARVLVSRNVVSRNHGEGIAIIISNHCTASDNQVSDNYSVEIYLDNAQWSTVERNFVYSTGDRSYFRFGQPAFGIGAANETYDVANPLEHITIANNIILRSRSAIFYGNYDRGGGLRSSIIANNTCYASTEPLVKIDDSSRNQATFVVNNIFYQSRSAPLADVTTRGVTFTNNSWNRAERGRAAGEGDVIGDPLLVKAGGTTPDEYRIAAGSPCVNTGTKVPTVTSDYWNRPRGAKYDIGAQELSSE
ncbi:MAG: putative calcium-binding protein [Acidobacteria bacterium]|nr:putative calcium-binding protein [Acidobacteriota bacterium]